MTGVRSSSSSSTSTSTLFTGLFEVEAIDIEAPFYVYTVESKISQVSQIAQISTVALRRSLPFTLPGVGNRFA